MTSVSKTKPASAVSGQAPPAGPQWVSRLAPLEPQALAYDKPLCASLDGFTLHAATRAGSTRRAGRRCCATCCELRSRRSAWSSVLTVWCASRLATSVPPPRLHTICSRACWPRRARGGRVSRAVDVLACPTCQGRMKLLVLVKGPASIARYLATVGEATEVPQRSPGRGPPYWKSRVRASRCSVTRTGTEHPPGAGGRRCRVPRRQGLAARDERDERGLTGEPPLYYLRSDPRERLLDVPAAADPGRPAAACSTWTR